MEKELLEQFQMLMGMMEKLPTEDRVRELIDERARHTEILIENTITKRIDALFDGYKSVRESQWELEHRVENLERIIEELRNKIA